MRTKQGGLSPRLMLGCFPHISRGSDESCLLLQRVTWQYCADDSGAAERREEAGFYPHQSSFPMTPAACHAGSGRVPSTEDTGSGEMDPHISFVTDCAELR